MLTNTSKSYLTPLAKRRIRTIANSWETPDLVLQDEGVNVAELSTEERKKFHKDIAFIGQALCHAFERPVAYRDWCLMWARVENARNKDVFWGRFLKADKQRIPGYIPYFKHGDDDLEKCLAHVQQHLAHKMAICANGCSKKYFFQRERNQRYCSKACRDKGRADTNSKYHEEHGKALRAAKRAAKKSRLKSALNGTGETP